MSCRHHPDCPGCPLHDLDREAQLDQKRARLARALGAFPHLPDAPEVQPAVRQDGYRHRLKLPVGFGRKGVSVGLYGTDRHTILHTPDCPVLAEGLREGLTAMLPWLSKHREVHSVDLRMSDHTRELQLVLAAEHGAIRGGDKSLKRLRHDVPSLVSIAVSTADPEKKRVMGRKPRLARGEPTLTEAIGETTYRLYPGAFFQADPQNAVQLHAMVREMVGPARRVLDLYAGVGSYGLMLAASCDEVVCVEEVPQAARAARDVAPDNVRVIASRVEDLDLSDPFDVAILNPARRGSDPGSLARVARQVDRLVYVSCGPETLARDLDCLASHGLRVKELRAIDLFPNTREVESIALLERGPPLRTWRAGKGRAGGPWMGHPSGALGRQEEGIALVIGRTRDEGRVGPNSYTRIGTVAGHSLIRLRLRQPLSEALRQLAQRGHPTAGRDPRTRRFFAQKAGLVRPFEHVLRADGNRAALHGDLQLALLALGAPMDAWKQTSPRRGPRAHPNKRRR